MIFFSGNNSLLACIKYLNYVWDASGSAPLDDGAGSWNSSGGTNWTLNGVTFGSWSNNNIAVFGVNNGTAGTITVGTVSTNGLFFRSPGSGNYTLSSGTITLNGNRPTINNLSNSTISSVLAGSNGLIKIGSGNLTLSGANTYTGNVFINGGILIDNITVNNSNPIATALGNMTISGRTITVNSGATLRFDAPDAIGAYNYTTPVTLIADGGTITRVSNTTTFNSIGNLILRNGGRLTTTNGNASTVLSFAINGSVTVSGTSGSYIDSAIGQNTNNGINLGTTTGSTTFDIASTGDPVADLTVSTTLSNKVLGGAANLIKNGSGKMLITSVCLYTGNTNINNGILKISDSGKLYALGYNNTANININSGGTLEIDSILYNGNLGQLADSSARRYLNGGTINVVGNSQTGAVDFQVGPGSSGTLNMVTAGQTLTFSDRVGDNILIGGPLTIGGAGNMVFNESIQNLTNAGSIIKNSSGSLDFNWPMGYTGSTTINNGIFNVNGANALIYSSSLVLNNGCTTNISANNWWIGGHGTAVPSSRTLIINNSTLLFTNSGESRIGNIILNNGSTLTSNRGLGSYDILLANVDTGAATVSVTGNAASTMNGSGGIHLQGIQNFDVSDVTGNANTDLTVSMILADPGASGGSAGGLNKIGNGTMVLSAINTYTGSTSILSGTLIVAQIISGPAKVNSATFTNITLTVDFNTGPLVGETYRILPGATTQTYGSVTLTGTGVAGRTGSYNSTNSTLTIS